MLARKRDGGSETARLLYDAFGSLKAPIQRVTRPHIPVPFSPPLEQYVIPGAGKIEAAVRKVTA